MQFARDSADTICTAKFIYSSTSATNASQSSNNKFLYSCRATDTNAFVSFGTNRLYHSNANVILPSWGIEPGVGKLANDVEYL